MVKDVVRKWFLDRGFSRQIDSYTDVVFDDLLKQRDAEVTLYYDHVWLRRCWGVINITVYYRDPELFAELEKFIA